ncbi:hypothetical protein OAP83_01365 [Rickettsiales bacterium]|nr:hypothetical protein [Rickettsiales bacterium]
MFEKLKAARTVLLINLLSQDKIQDSQRKAIEEGNLLVLDKIDFSAPSDKSQKEFLIDLNELEKFPSVQGLNAIVENYISKTAENQININSRLRGEIENAAKDPEKIAEITSALDQVFVNLKNEYQESRGQLPKLVQALVDEFETNPKLQLKTGVLSFSPQTTLKELRVDVEELKEVFDIKNLPTDIEHFDENSSYLPVKDPYVPLRYSINKELRGDFSSEKVQAQGSKYEQAKLSFDNLKKCFDQLDQSIKDFKELQRITGHHVDHSPEPGHQTSHGAAVLEKRKEAEGKGQER